MTPAARIVYLLMLLIGLSVGALAGFQTALFDLRNYDDLKGLAGPKALEEFSYKQYRYADSEHAKAALQTYASFLEEMEKLHPNKAHETALWVAHTRIALLEDAGNDGASSDRSMAKAQFWHVITGSRNYSAAEMKTAVNESDERLRELDETPLFPKRPSR
jgi:hypothetical protein